MQAATTSKIPVSILTKSAANLISFPALQRPAKLPYNSVHIRDFHQTGLSRPPFHRTCCLSVSVIERSAVMPTGFLDIPLELRRRIYEYVLIANFPLSTYIRDTYVPCVAPDRRKSLLLLSKQISTEALEVLYGSNIFQVSLYGITEIDGCTLLNKSLSEANRRKIRKLELPLNPYLPTYASTPDISLLAPVLPQLTKLTIVTRPPTIVNGGNDPSLLDDYSNTRTTAWRNWTQVVLEDIVSQLPKSLEIEVDDNDGCETRGMMGAETTALMEKYFPGGYRQVQTRTGHDIFARRDFALDSACWDDDYVEPTGPYVPYNPFY